MEDFVIEILDKEQIISAYLIISLFHKWGKEGQEVTCDSYSPKEILLEDLL